MRRRWTKGIAAPLVLAAALCGAAAAQDDTLYRQLGGQPAIRRVVDDLIERLLADARLAPFFRDTNRAQFASQLTDQLCELSGGPCRYEGPTMAQAHEAFEISRGDFLALVERLQDALDAQGVPQATQRALLARLAPMHRAIVNRL